MSDYNVLNHRNIPERFYFNCAMGEATHSLPTLRSISQINQIQFHQQIQTLKVNFTHISGQYWDPIRFRRAPVCYFINTTMWGFFGWFSILEFSKSLNQDWFLYLW